MRARKLHRQVEPPRLRPGWRIAARIAIGIAVGCSTAAAVLGLGLSTVAAPVIRHDVNAAVQRALREAHDREMAAWQAELEQRAKSINYEVDRELCGCVDPDHTPASRWRVRP